MGVSDEDSDPGEPEREREWEGCERGVDCGWVLRVLDDTFVEPGGDAKEGETEESLEEARWEPGGARRCCDCMNRCWKLQCSTKYVHTYSWRSA